MTLFGYPMVWVEGPTWPDIVLWEPKAYERHVQNMKNYKVKPLEWRFTPTESMDWHSTSTVLGPMDIRYEGMWYWYAEWDEFEHRRCQADTLDQAKADAEAFYLSRLLPALEMIRDGP